MGCVVRLRAPAEWNAHCVPDQNRKQKTLQQNTSPPQTILSEFVFLHSLFTIPFVLIHIYIVCVCSFGDRRLIYIALDCALVQIAPHSLPTLAALADHSIESLFVAWGWGEQAHALTAQAPALEAVGAEIIVTPASSAGMRAALWQALVRAADPVPLVLHIAGTAVMCDAHAAVSAAIAVVPTHACGCHCAESMPTARDRPGHNPPPVRRCSISGQALSGGSVRPAFWIGSVLTCPELRQDNSTGSVWYPARHPLFPFAVIQRTAAGGSIDPGPRAGGGNHSHFKCFWQHLSLPHFPLENEETHKQKVKAGT